MRLSQVWATRVGRHNMFVLVVLSLTLTLHDCMPASQSLGVEVMPKMQLAYLVEDGQYRQTDLAKQKQRQKWIQHRDKRQTIQPASTVQTEVDVAEEQEIKEPEERNSFFSADIARVLAAAGAKPSPIDPDARSYAGRRRRSPGGIEHFHNNAQEEVTKANAKSHGNIGKVVQMPAVIVKKDQSDFINGDKERRKRNVRFIPFSVYDARRIKTLKLEENDFHALPQRLQIEKQAQLARQAKALKIQLTAKQ